MSATIRAQIIRPSTALRLRARRECTDATGTKRRSGEEWLIRAAGACVFCCSFRFTSGKGVFVLLCVLMMLLLLLLLSSSSSSLVVIVLGFPAGLGSNNNVHHGHYYHPPPTLRCVCLRCVRWRALACVRCVLVVRAGVWWCRGPPPPPGISRPWTRR